MLPKKTNIRLLLLFAALTVIGVFFSILYLQPSPTPDSPQSSSPTPNQTDDVFNQPEHFLDRGDELHKNFQHQDAIRYFKDALRLYREANNQAKEAITLGRIGSVYHDLSNYNEAIEFHKKRLLIADSIGDKREKFAALSSLGNAYDMMGNYAEALNYYTQSKDLAPTIIDYPQGLAISQGQLGNIYHKLGDYETAIKKHNEHLTIAAIKLKDLNLAGDAYSGLGNAYFARKKSEEEKKGKECNGKIPDFEKAIKYHRLRLTISKQIGDLEGEAIAWGSLGSVYHHLWKCNKKQNDLLDKAIKYQDKRREIAQKIEKPRLEGSAYGGLAHVYYSRKDYFKTIEYANKYLEISRATFDYPGQGNALNLLGVAHFKSGNFDQAKLNIEEAIKVRKPLREGLTDTEKVFIFDTEQTAYLNLQQILISKGKNEQALEIAEQGRAQAFLDLLAKQLNNNQEIFNSINIEEIKKIAFDQKATLVVYSIVENSIVDHRKPLYVWVVKPTGEVEFRTNDLNIFKEELSNRKGLQNLVVGDWRDLAIAWHRSFDSPNKAAVPGSEQEERKKILQAYYNLLIKPIDKLLPTKENEKVIFVPHGALFLVPFAALQNPSNEKYLIQKHTILTAPSIQAIQFLSQRRTQKQNIKPNSESEDVLIVGIKKYVKDFKKGSRQFCSRNYLLKDLPKAAEEATEIAKILGLSPAKALIDDKATEAAVKQRMPQARIIHLATHGLLDSCEEEAAVPGALVLAESSETDKANDSWLTASEIFDMKDKEDRRLDKAELVVLSACDTGGGRLTGDGVIGLSRSLIAAGTPSVIVSLRKVNDKSTKVLMTRFYHYWYKKKLDKAQALRQAMLDTMNATDSDTKTKYKDPSYWSAFTLIGLP